MANPFVHVELHTNAADSGTAPRRQGLARPYIPVSVALPIAFAFTMNPTSEAWGSFGTSSVGTLSA